MNPTEFQDFLFKSQTVRLRLAVTFGVLLLYLLLFLLLFPTLGLPTVILSAVPAILAGFILGIPAGLFTGFLVIPINVMLLNFVGINGANALFDPGAILGAALAIFLSIGAGGLRNLLLNRRLEITALREAEFALSDSERRYHGLFENSPISLWVEDFSEVKILIDQVKLEHPNDIGDYLEQHPEYVSDCISRVKVVDVNNASLELYRANSKEELLANLDKLFTSDSLAVFRQELVAIANGESAFRSESQNLTLAGETIDIELHWSVAPGHEEKLDRVLLSITDTTRRKLAERAAAEQSRRIEAISGISKALSTAGLQLDSIFNLIAERVSDLFGDACVLAIVSDDGEWLHPVAFHHDDPDVKQFLGELFQNTPLPMGKGHAGLVAQTGEAILIPEYSKEQVREDTPKRYKPYLERYSIHSLLIVPLLAQGDILGTLGVSRDVPGKPYTQEEMVFLQAIADRCALSIANARLHDQVAAQARTDGLTGLFNRRYFLELAERELQRAIRYKRPLSLVMIDVDHFKQVNDTHGHPVGDEVLMETAQRLISNLRSTDILARFGGEEFVVLLPDTGLDGSHSAAARLHGSIRGQKFQTSAADLDITISLGIAFLSDEISTMASLLDHADSALYAAKESGRDRLVLGGQIE